MDVRNSEEIIPYMVQTLTAHLQNSEQVVWLIPGGSGIGTATEIAAQLVNNNVDLTRLLVTITDERYGPVGHEDENWQQLIDRNITLGDAKIYRVLQHGLSLEDTASAFSTILEEWLTSCDFAIGMFGIGADGHIAGIKPQSPALTQEVWAIGYEWEDFTRITSTPKAISALNEAVAYAVGPEKTATLKSLTRENLPIEQQPAQIFKQVPKHILFTDFKEGEE